MQTYSTVYYLSGRVKFAAVNTTGITDKHSLAKVTRRGFVT